MIQDISQEFKNQFKKVTPDSNDYVVCFKGNEILLPSNDASIYYPKVSQVEKVGEFLFEIEDRRYFLGCVETLDGYDYYPLSSLRKATPQYEAFAGVVAFHLYNWYNENKFCGKCGSKMHHSDTERAKVCDCGNIVYPKICPAVIVGVISGGKICLTKYNRPNTNWALVAGFNEIGETIEQTVHREVMEEIGLKVKNLKYYKSQPWGLTSTLLMGFYCTVDGDEKIKLDNVELKDGKWSSPDEIDFENDGFSLTREMIENFKNGLVF